MKALNKSKIIIQGFLKDWHKGLSSLLGDTGMWQVCDLTVVSLMEAGRKKACPSVYFGNDRYGYYYYYADIHI